MRASKSLPTDPEKMLQKLQFPQHQPVVPAAYRPAESRQDRKQPTLPGPTAYWHRDHRVYFGLQCLKRDNAPGKLTPASPVSDMSPHHYYYHRKYVSGIQARRF